MFKRAYGIAVAATALAAVTGSAAFAASASPASAMTAHTSARTPKDASSQSLTCTNFPIVIFGKCINSVNRNNTRMYAGPGTGTGVTGTVASTSNAIADYCVLVGFNHHDWDLVYDPRIARAGFIDEAHLKHNGQLLVC